MDEYSMQFSIMFMSCDRSGQPNGILLSLNHTFAAFDILSSWKIISHLVIETICQNEFYNNNFKLILLETITKLFLRNKWTT